MAPIKRSRLGAGDEIIEVESASSNLRRDPRKRQRLSNLESAQDRSLSTSDEEGEFVYTATQLRTTGTQFKDYERQRDEGPSDASDHEVDVDREAQRVRQQRGRLTENIPSENGIIESITCYNFMCHTKLEVKLGPLINFIIGHNGSGKSAVLTALTLCLGAKATSTNRGQNLKSFIKEGQESSVIIVKIKNQGIGSYQADVYGDSIIVERHFNKAGTSGFKLKSAAGRIISTKKSELDEICEFYALHLDNPINVLTQDMARQFLNSASPDEKYRFFIKGVQLEQLDNDYQIIAESLNDTESALEMQEDELKILWDKKKVALQRLELSNKQESLRQKVKSYGNQMAWAQVEGEERTLIQKEDDLDSALKKIEVRRQEADEATNAYDRANEKAEVTMAAVTALNKDVEPLVEEQKSAKERFDANKTELSDIITQQRSIREFYLASENRVKKLEEDCAQERALLEAADGGSQANKLRDIDDAEARVVTAEACKEQHGAELAPLEADAAKAKAQAERIKPVLDAKRDDIRQAEARLRGLSSDHNQQQSAYHKNLPTLLRAIQREERFREQPVGPIGHFVKLLKPEWSSIIERTFGQALNSFVVTSKEDQTLLSEVMRRCNCQNQIYIGRSNRLDVSRNEPDPALDTILRVLEIDNDLVRNQLIINNAIENTVLIKSRAEAYTFMYDGERPRCVKACIAMHDTQPGSGIRMQHGRGGANIGPVAIWMDRPRMKTDIEAQISLQTEVVQSLKREMHEVEQRMRMLNEQATKASQAVNRHKIRSKQLHIEVQRAEDDVGRLRDELEAEKPQDGRLDALKDNLAQAEQEKEQYDAQLKAAADQREILSLRGREFKQAVDGITKQIEELENKTQKARLKFDSSSEARQLALRSKNEALQRIEKAQLEHTEMASEVEAFKEHVQDFVRQALLVSERVPVDRGETVQSLDRKLHKLTDDVKRYERELGGAHDQLDLDAIRARVQYENARSKFDDTTSVVMALKLALSDRLDRWFSFRDHIAWRTRSAFQYLLTERGFRGELFIHHRTRTLDLRIEPDITRKGNAKGRATTTLSGGEKSFSTICLLLALWEAMCSPIRCLDEFDVFMDSVNRDISMKMMIGAARRSIGRQFILITPQSMANVEAGPDLKIIKLHDPERRQTALNFRSQ